MKRLIFSFYIGFLAIAGLVLLSCSKDSATPGNSATAQKGYVTGKVTDDQNKPITGASILLDNAIAYAAYVNGTSGNDGNYKIKLPTGNYSIWKASATIQKSYNNRTYTLDLAPDNTNSITEEGAVCNFKWKLTGQKPGENTYYGGTIDMDAGTGTSISDWHGIEVILTPSGPLIDGSAGQVIKVMFGSTNWQNYESGITDIPIGQYKAAAVFHYNNATYQLNLQNRQTSDVFKQEVVFDFEPENRWGHKNAATLEFHE